jgi:hypothetical protein
MPKSAEKEQDDSVGVECEDCILREHEGQPRYMRMRHSDKGRLLPNGRKLKNGCEACGGSGRVPEPRFW